MRYRAESGAVIDNETGTVWHSGWKQWEAEAIAEALSTKDFSRLIFRPGMYIVGVRPNKRVEPTGQPSPAKQSPQPDGSPAGR